MKHPILLSLYFALHLAACSSTDPPVQTDWTKNGTSPVLPKGTPYDYDFYVISDCSVLYHEGQYKMWYTGGGAVLPDETLRSRICYATSPDGIHWTKDGKNPVLDVSATDWDSLGVETASVMVDEQAPANQRYKMWYAGQTMNDYKYDIGYAYSQDGKTWVKHGAPVLQVGAEGSWDNCFLEGPTVIQDDGVYKMWYAAYDCVVNDQVTDGKVNIGYATSTDGIHWTKHITNPVLTVSAGMWDATYVQDPHVIKYDGNYHMWYGGADVSDNYFQQTGYAFSSDGIHWEKSSRNPVLTRGINGAWDANTASFPSVLIVDNELQMWYTGKDVDPLPEWPTPYFWEIGYARKVLSSSQQLD